MLVCTAILLVSMMFTAATSLRHTEITRPLVETSPLSREMALDLAASDAVYISEAEEKAGLEHLIKKKLPLYCGGTKNYAALTFDDGPSETSPRLIKLLSEEGVSATWFDIGNNANTYTAQLKEQGEYGPIGNHTWNHANLTTLSPSDIKTELTDTQDVVKSGTGQDWPMMRPPYGARDAATEKTIRKLGYSEILWSADSQDGLAKPEATIATNAVNGLGPGAIILFHDGTNPATITALKKTILPRIRKSGLTMVTIPELMVLNPPTDAQLEAGPMGCSHAGKVNVSGTFLTNPESR
ncbi:MAG: polysaccharide deacetylase family protein [Solirubrobacterales bacterium]